MATAISMQPLAAQVQAERRASPELTARVDGVVGAESEALKIAQLDVSVRIHGSMATTEMTVRFDNPTGQTLEGEFALDLPKGSVVTGYALDVGQDMIDGVL